ncbi:MAG: hypothetical protein A3E88_06895 [Legionellales bacterium RIFCSPHIGHO2_12_FULL_35_11]|nr:MAG: hypothetical protein A3E88_06895 [Legionellales bacterium RIFCSPHIGHO2_12_FULL_35_11]
MNKDNQIIFAENLTIHTVKAELDRLLLLIKNKALYNYNFDLGEVTFFDSAGLALLVEIKRICEQQNIAYSFSRIPQAIFSIAEFCEVDGVL